MVDAKDIHFCTWLYKSLLYLRKLRLNFDVQTCSLAGEDGKAVPNDQVAEEVDKALTAGNAEETNEQVPWTCDIAWNRILLGVQVCGLGGCVLVVVAHKV